ncbi:MAG: superoxide dismutase [Acidobacteriota bacterium]|nr:superoxide dismutase [Acidobacteriota bacterium]
METQTATTNEEQNRQTYPFSLPPLGYDFDALAPFIDAETMELHHDKHHQAYVDKLNDALKDQADLQKHSIEELLAQIDSLPDAVKSAVRNNGGGHANHSMFWTIMQKNENGKPSGSLAEAIDRDFGSFEDFKEKFNDAGAKQFGSGWVFLVSTGDKLEIKSMPNQDTPLMQGVTPIMGNDVWEHAYYVTYRNRRPEYLKQWWNVVNWDEVQKRFEANNA